jgi:AcrR family transcriptional regulator/biotin operon repressor
MVASVSERGYAATRISDLAQLSGVSTNSFYGLFADKKACFVAALEEMVAVATRVVKLPTGTWEERVRRGAAAFAELVVAQPAAARMCLIEAFAVGPEGMKPLELATTGFEAHMMEMAMQSPEQAGMPAEMITANVGAILEITRNLLRRGKEAELPELMNEYADLVLSHRPPPEPLRLTARPPNPAPETIDAHDHEQRALRAFAVVAAERGYANTTINQIVKRASMSPTTFYANFRDKEDALMAAIDSAGAQMVAAILPAFRRNQDWAHGVRAAYGAFFNFLASRPALARLVMVEVYAAGPRAVERREEALRPLEVLLAEGRARSPKVPAIAIEAITGGIYALTYKQIRDTGPEGLPGLAPICTYLTLAPFIGVEEACAAANGDGRTRAPDRESIRAVGVQAMLTRVLQAISEQATSAEEIADQIGIPTEAVAHYIDELENVGYAELVEERVKDGRVERLYGSSLRRLSGQDWAAMTLAERQRISEQIAHLIRGDWDEAVEAGSFDGRPDRHMSRLAFLVDQQGWHELLEISDEALTASIEVQRKSAERLKQSGEEGVDGRMVQLLFEMPRLDPPES